MGAVWSALLVGGGLAGALLVWLLRGGPGDAGEDDPPREAADGRGPDHLQESNALLISETKTGETSGNERLESHVGERRVQKGQETPAKAATQFAEKLPSNSPHSDRAKKRNQAQLDTQAPAGHEHREMVSRHSSWGDVGLGGTLEASGVSLSRDMHGSRGNFVDGKRTGTANPSSESEQVSVRFQVHYLTSSDAQLVAVTGDHESLGKWDAYVPLRPHKDGLWAHAVLLPADSVVQWKFVLVENGGVARWEECSNRRLATGHEDKVVHGWWGVH
ncbi:PREDICTED: starch-binding domain-containing protein 1 [Chinchilla lanigera]|uniref:starch-binding domain-containing protein 1 n=1 Tax=Chinchilla lanigera TaxID=34839 RepID=UPI000696D25C|nr:PREDICTED: starch-binding domain-containing protein 1 [Chinchilla lanigera]